MTTLVRISVAAGIILSLVLPFVAAAVLAETVGLERHEGVAIAVIAALAYAYLSTGARTRRRQLGQRDSRR